MELVDILLVWHFDIIKLDILYTELSIFGGTSRYTTCHHDHNWQIRLRAQNPQHKMDFKYLRGPSTPMMAMTKSACVAHWAATAMTSSSCFTSDSILGQVRGELFMDTMVDEPWVAPINGLQLLSWHPSRSDHLRYQGLNEKSPSWGRRELEICTLHGSWR